MNQSNSLVLNTNLTRIWTSKNNHDTYVTASLIIPALKECILDIKEQTIENDEVIKFQKELLEGLSNRCEQFFIDDNLRWTIIFI